MAYKSNKQALAEYLDNKAKNHERYARDYARRKASRGGSFRRKIVVALLALIGLVWYLSHRGPGYSPSKVSTYPASYRP